MQKVLRAEDGQTRLFRSSAPLRWVVSPWDLGGSLTKICMLRRVFSSVFSLGTLGSKYRVDVEAGSSIPDHADAIQAGKEKPTEVERARQESPPMHPPPPLVHGVPTAPAPASAAVQYAARAPSLVAAESMIGGIIDSIVGSIEHEDRSNINRWPNPAGANTEGEPAEHKDKATEIQEEEMASANERTEVLTVAKGKPKKYTPAMNGVSGIIRLYDFSAPDANGDIVDFARYSGKVVLVINVASRCDFTGPMYDHIRELQNRFGADDDFKILAFPCNQFLKREPLSAVEVCRFAEATGRRAAQNTRAEIHNVSHAQTPPDASLERSRTHGGRGERRARPRRFSRTGSIT